MSESLTISWEEFLSEATEFIKVSEKLGDQWQLIRKDNNEDTMYLSKSMKIYVNLKDENSTDEITQTEFSEDEVEFQTPNQISNSEDLISVEYHIVYSISYQVPVLYFRGHKSDGRPITLEDSWKIFSNHGMETKKKKTKEDMLSILTQTDHPILFKPFLSLHPCQTAKILAQTNNSKNRIVTFLSVFGPYVKLNLTHDYALAFN